jgi:hypothetical protein
MGSGWQEVNGKWRMYRKVPLHLRAFLPGKHKNKTTLTLSAKTGNKTEALAIAARKGFGTT